MADAATAAVEAMLAAGADPPPPDRPLGDPEVEQRLADLDGLLAQVEAIPGPAGRLAVEAVAAVAEVYGAALTRVMAYASGGTGPAGGRLLDALTGDPLLGHLLALHGIHPEPAEGRIARALDDVRAQHGPSAEVALGGVADGVAEVRVAGGGGCGHSAGALADVVRDAVLAAAPELAEVRVVPVEAARPATFIPLDALRHVPSGPGPRR